MNFQMFVLGILIIFSLALLCAHGIPHPGLVQSRAAKVRTTLHRLLKPRSPAACPACRLASTAWSGGRPVPAPVRPWSEVKSRRGAPKRVNTAGFACPNRSCLYFGNTDAQIHALVGDGKHGRAERIQTFRCQACRTTFTARRNTTNPYTYLLFPYGRTPLLSEPAVCLPAWETSRSSVLSPPHKGYTPHFRK